LESVGYTYENVAGGGCRATVSGQSKAGRAHWEDLDYKLDCMEAIVYGAQITIHRMREQDQRTRTVADAQIDALPCACDCAYVAKNVLLGA
jgi:hypothetical protein